MFGLQLLAEYAEEALPFEECVEANGIKVYIDPMATMFILGSEMDYQEDKLNAGFVFTNPNETGVVVAVSLSVLSPKSSWRFVAALTIVKQNSAHDIILMGQG